MTEWVPFSIPAFLAAVGALWLIYSALYFAWDWVVDVLFDAGRFVGKVIKAAWYEEPIERLETVDDFWSGSSVEDRLRLRLPQRPFR